ncbi:MAG: adenosylcobinamide-GDP ribazoletransferase [Coriobacteriales bacterium]
MSGGGSAGGRGAGGGLRRALGAASIALSMFSRIPVRPASWDGPSMRWALAFWPLVGVVEGLAYLAWGWASARLGVPRPLCAAVFVALPFAVNGGIHADGLCDTADALASRLPRDRALQVMADPRVGSFAALCLGCHLALSFGLFSCIDLGWGTLACVAASPVMSRALAGLTVARWKCARPGGLADAFGSAASPSCSVALLAEAVACAAAMVWSCRIGGALAVAVALATLGWYRRMTGSRFGGVTGDTSGWFVQTAELAMLAAVVVGGLVG